MLTSCSSQRGAGTQVRLLSSSTTTLTCSLLPRHSNRDTILCKIPSFCSLLIIQYIPNKPWPTSTSSGHLHAPLQPPINPLIATNIIGRTCYLLVFVGTCVKWPSGNLLPPTSYQCRVTGCWVTQRQWQYCTSYHMIYFLYEVNCCFLSILLHKYLILCFFTSYSREIIIQKKFWSHPEAKWIGYWLFL